MSSKTPRRPTLYLEIAFNNLRNMPPPSLEKTKKMADLKTVPPICNQQ